MIRHYFLFTFWLGAFNFCAFAAPKAPVEIKSPAEIRLYKRLQKQAKQREQSFRWTQVQARIENKTRHNGRIITLVSPDGRKYIRLEGKLQDIWYRASIHDARNGALLIQLPSPKEECGGAFEPQWSPNGKIVSFSEVENQNSLFFDAKSGKKLWEGSNYYLYAPKSQTVAMIFGGYEGGKRFDSVFIRHARTGKILRHLSPRLTTWGLVLEFFSPDGSQLYVRASGNDKRRWRLSVK